MRVLIGCEFSGVVREAFKARGHDALSVDLLPTTQPGNHYQGDILKLIRGYGVWDLAIFHPPCTYLTCSAEWAYNEYQKKNIKPGTLIGEARQDARDEAVQFFLALAHAKIPKIAVENPVGVMSTRFRKANQYIQPWQFGHDASKKTGLWLKNLPILRPTQLVAPRLVCCGEVLPDGDKYGCPNCNGTRRALPRWANQTNSGQNREPPGEDRWKIRSVTWQGIADAMADQWG